MPRATVAFGICAALLLAAGCATRTNVSATANSQAQYAHVWLTVEQVWLHASATAGPDDSGWEKFALATPETFDLVGLTAGQLALLGDRLKVPSGSYRQLRVLLSDSAGALVTSAQDAGLRFNNEVDYFDGSGAEQQARLDVAQPAKGIGVAVTLEVPNSASFILAGIGGSTAASTSTGATTTATSSTTPTGTTAAVSSGTGAAAASAAIDFDAARDLVPFSYSGQRGFFLNPHLAAWDLSHAGTIRGQLNVAALTADANTGRLDVQVSAETLSADSSRHVVVKSAPVSADGSFVLYPLSTAAGDPTTYDLVIHGPLVQTVIIKALPVSPGAPSSAPPVALGSIGLVAASSFNVNLASGNTVSPAGARVGFYQTLPGSAEVPYLIEARAVDPLSGAFASDQALSSADLVFGTYAAGQTLPLSGATPVEGAGTYKVAAQAPLFADGAFGPTVSAPGGGSGATAGFTCAPLALASGARADTIGTTLSIATPGRYDRGELVITHEGAVVVALPLDGLLAQASATLTVSGVPGGAAGASFAPGVYYAEAWVWSSSDAVNTLSLQPGDAVIDLRQGSATGAAVNIL